MTLPQAAFLRGPLAGNSCRTLQRYDDQAVSVNASRVCPLPQGSVGKECSGLPDDGGETLFLGKLGRRAQQLSASHGVP